MPCRPQALSSASILTLSGFIQYQNWVPTFYLATWTLGHLKIRVQLPSESTCMLVNGGHSNQVDLPPTFRELGDGMGNGREGSQGYLSG